MNINNKRERNNNVYRQSQDKGEQGEILKNRQMDRDITDREREREREGIFDGERVIKKSAGGDMHFREDYK